MNDKEIDEMIAKSHEDAGRPFTAAYVRKYGYKEPLYGNVVFGDDFEKQEARAKLCIETNKTASQMKLDMKFEGVKE